MQHNLVIEKIMARYYIIMLSIVLLINCYTQAAPAPDQDETSTANNIEDAFQKIADSFSNGFKNIMADPKVGEFVKGSQKFFENAAQNIRSEATKLIPKTDESQLATR